MATNISDIYGSLVFNDKVMKERLPKPVYRAFTRPSRRAPRLTTIWPTPSHMR